MYKYFEVYPFAYTYQKKCKIKCLSRFDIIIHCYVGRNENGTAGFRKKKMF